MERRIAAIKPPTTLVNLALDETSDPPWQRQTVSIARFTLQEITMCIESSVDGDFSNPEDILLWANPQILSAEDRKRRAARAQRISEQEQRLQEQQLKTLGYVD